MTKRFATLTLLALAAAGMLAANAMAQIDVTKSFNANDLRDEILGMGITANGIATFDGSTDSAGFFTGGASSIGIDSGIILTTGDARFAEPVNNSENSKGNASGDGDADLDAEFGLTTLDTTFLEFDFDTAGGDITFNFVFASEEYNDFVNTQFNDVFGFFLNGTNIGLIPGTSTPVSVNTVNGGNPFGDANATNPQFYNNNSPNDGGTFLNELGYDGFTDVFTASALGVTPGTHTLKLAISDVGDNILDSAVFIGAGSLVSQEPANASFDGAADINTLNIDFGAVDQGDVVGDIAFAIHNYVNGGGPNADLDLDSVSGSGDTGILTTDLAPFAGLGSGDSNAFAAMLDTATAGIFSATYTLDFSNSESLTLNLSGTVIPEPSTLMMILLGALASCSCILRRRWG